MGASAAANAAEAVDADDDSGEDSEDGTLLSGSRFGLVGMHLFDQFQQTSAGPPGPNLARPEPRARRRATLEGEVVWDDVSGVSGRAAASFDDDPGGGDTVAVDPAIGVRGDSAAPDADDTTPGDPSVARSPRDR